mmetsp:Transcript_14065/g.26542  ORF Transcript_14065/g.26542 Transcript_14065/m.26542 type:complete len:209 (-) Transcript_14065:2294-2920(-)
MFASKSSRTAAMVPTTTPRRASRRRTETDRRRGRVPAAEAGGPPRSPGAPMRSWCWRTTSPSPARNWTEPSPSGPPTRAAPWDSSPAEEVGARVVRPEGKGRRPPTRPFPTGPSSSIDPSTDRSPVESRPPRLRRLLPMEAGANETGVKTWRYPWPLRTCRPRRLSPSSRGRFAWWRTKTPSPPSRKRRAATRTRRPCACRGWRLPSG